jgi:hypothetical protein
MSKHRPYEKKSQAVPKERELNFRYRGKNKEGQN